MLLCYLEHQAFVVGPQGIVVSFCQW
jgi:hypothetical protein